MTTALDTNKLLLTVPDLKARNPTQFMLNLAFRLTATSETEVVTIDVKKGRRIIAPLVSPRLPGKLMQKRGTETRTIKPAYLKPKFDVDPSETLKRLAGEPLNGTLSPQARLDALTAERLQDGIAYVDRRMEVMACDALVNGKVTLVAEEYDTTEVDYQRDSGLTLATPPSGTDWDDNGAVPLHDLEDINLVMIQASGLGITDVVFDPKAFRLFSDDAGVKAKLQNFPAQQDTIRLLQGAQGSEGGMYVGQIGMWRLWVYQSWYVDPADNTEKQCLPDYTVLPLNAEGMLGVQHFGAIRDTKGLHAVPYFPKVWEDEDPSVRWAMIQSAPIVSIERPDASASMVVAGN
jgi:hypothetical protein